MSRSRFNLDGLRAALDLPQSVTITGAGVSADGLLDLELAGATWGDSDEEAELVAEYSVDSFGRRTFVRFKLPDVADANLGTVDPDEVVDAPVPETTLPPSGPGSRGGAKAKE